MIFLLTIGVTAIISGILIVNSEEALGFLTALAGVFLSLYLPLAIAGDVGDSPGQTTVFEAEYPLLGQVELATIDDKKIVKFVYEGVNGPTSAEFVYDDVVSITGTSVLHVKTVNYEEDPKVYFPWGLGKTTSHITIK